jgi:ESCRT-II complex subunit VPS25
MSFVAANKFVYPDFWNYPPYFTLQPVPETRQKQLELWRALILSYCQHNRQFIIYLDGNVDFPPFSNPSINRHLSRQARVVVLDHAAHCGSGEWLDSKTKHSFLILWKSIQVWADGLYSLALENGLRNSVVTIDELRSGEYTRGTEYDQLPVKFLSRLIKELQDKGKAKFFRGSRPDEEGVKFF